MNTRSWRTPAVVLLCGGMALNIAIGVRQNMGLYLHPMTTDLGMSRQTFSFAIAQIFGVRYLSTLTGIAFVFHQLGSFLGAGLGGYLFDTTGSYQLMWMLTIAMGVVSAILNWPVDDRPIERWKNGVRVTFS